MPTLVRLLSVLALIAGSVFAVMLALVTFVEPARVPVSVSVPVPGLVDPAPAVAPEAAESGAAPTVAAPAVAAQ